MSMNRQISRIALPAIVTNVTIPVLGLIDTAISGHLGAAAYIGAVAVGSMMFNLIYWNFGFLRMGTSGLAAQAYGRGDRHEATHVLVQSSLLALIIAALIVILQVPLQWVTLLAIGPTPEVKRLAQIYYYICVWGAPPLLLMMAFKGWMLGMQDSTGPMKISIGVNVVNIVASLTAVYGFDMGFEGIAFGTMVSGYVGVLYSLWLFVRHFGWLRHELPQVRHAFRIEHLGRYFSVNADIFVRSALMMFVMLFFMAVGARNGELILAVNALIMQMFTLYSYFLDGVAFAGEAVVGKYYGGRRWPLVRECVRYLFGWAIGFTLIFTLLYLFPRTLFTWLTDQREVIEAAMSYRWWCALIPIAGMAAFVWDGVFIGMTRTRGMLVAVFLATAIFFVTYTVLPHSWGNNRLWLAFILFLSVRGVTQTIIYNKIEVEEKKSGPGV